jgi:protein TonB
MVLASDQDGGSLDALQFSFASEIVELVVLTRDELFLQTLREAVGGARRLWHVLSAEKVSDLLVAGQVGIVVLDVAAMHEAASVFVAQIKRQFPDLVMVVAGHRDAEIELAPLISAGAVYRFIHKPVSPGRARLFADAAVRKYGEQRLRAAEAPVRGTPRRNHLPLGMAAVAALAVIIAVVWAVGHSARRDPGVVPAAASNPSSAQAQLLARAAAALAANRLTAPEGDNALELYLRANAQSPADPVARAGVAEVRDRLLARAENALLEERLDEAGAAIETARRSGVESGRIAFLSAQLAKLKDQVKAVRARAAAKAAPTPTPVEGGAVQPGAGQPGAVPTGAGQSGAAQTLASLVALALQRLDAGQLTEPEHDNARHYVEAALSLDPNDDAAQDARRALAAALLGDARAAIDRRDFAHAAQRLQDAQGMATPASVETLQALLSGARQEARADAMAQLLRSAGERLQQDRLIEPANDSAKYYLLTLRDLEPGHPGLAPALQELGSRLVAKARLALTLQQYDAARSWLDESAAVGYTSAESSSVQHDLQAAVARQKFLSDLVPSGELTLLKSVQPIYPARAQSSRTEGWVELDFTVAEDGRVQAIEVHAASAAGVFDDAAIKAVSQWRYQPVLRENMPTAVRTRVRIRFTAP